MKINILKVNIPYFILKNSSFFSLSLTGILDLSIETQRDTAIFHAITTIELFKGKCLREKGHCKAKEDLETTQQSHIATRKFEMKGKL